MTQDQIATYKAALKAARAAFKKASLRLDEIHEEGVILGDEITRLRRTITALSALCSESPGMDQLGITDSCIEVMDTEKGQLTTAEVVKKLEDMGFDITSQKNASASVHAILSRLARNEKIQRIEDGSSAVAWRGPNFDPEYMDVPF